jgi:hypothetical protein
MVMMQQPTSLEPGFRHGLRHLVRISGSVVDGIFAVNQVHGNIISYWKIHENTGNIVNKI